jgi:hypothetical protein
MASARQPSKVLAASDVDPERPASAPGVPADAVQASVAVARCEAAVTAVPGNRRVIFQLGRVYQAAKDYEKARAQCVRADALGHSGAANNLGTLISRGLGGERDLAEARRLYENCGSRRRRVADAPRARRCRRFVFDIGPLMGRNGSPLLPQSRKAGSVAALVVNRTASICRRRTISGP